MSPTSTAVAESVNHEPKVARGSRSRILSFVDPVFFATPNELRSWFRRNHLSQGELWIGYYKTGSGRPSITWPESVDEALCFGWIDGIRKGIDLESYKIRFTRRRRGSIWSALNIRRVAVLTEKGGMTPSGLKAFVARRENKSGIYSYEQRRAELPAPYLSLMRANQQAWEFYHRQPPSYRKTLAWWVVSAKQETTRMKRLQSLIMASERGVRLR